MKVKALVSMCIKKISISKGSIADIDKKVAKKLAKDGLVEIIQTQEKKIEKRRKKDDTPKEEVVEVKEDVK